MTRRITHITALILSLLSLSLHAQNLNESVIEPLNESLDKPHDELPDNQPLVLDTMTVTYTPAYRGDMAPEELPQSTDVLDSSLLTGPITDLQAALTLSPSVARQNSLGGLWDSFAVRGFPGNENMPSGYLINGFSGGRGFSARRDISAIDSIEVQKGPGSALYGRGEPGGTINIITKNRSLSLKVASPQKAVHLITSDLKAITPATSTMSSPLG